MSEIGKELATTRLKVGAVVMVAVKGTSDNLPLFLYNFYSSYLSLFIFVRTGSVDICTYHLKKYAYALLKTSVFFTLSDWYCEQKICNHDAGGNILFLRILSIRLPSLYARLIPSVEESFKILLVSRLVGGMPLEKCVILHFQW